MTLGRPVSGISRPLDRDDIAGRAVVRKVLDFDEDQDDIHNGSIEDVGNDGSISSIEDVAQGVNQAKGEAI